MVLSEYSFNSFKAALTSSNVVPCFAVFVNIVCIEFIFSSYSLKPSVTGSIANDLTKFLPAFTALFVILASAVVAITPRAENLAVTVSTPLVKPDIPNPDSLFKLSFTPSSPLLESFILSFSLSC